MKLEEDLHSRHEGKADGARPCVCADRGADLRENTFNWLECLFCPCKQCFGIFGSICMQGCKPHRCPPIDFFNAEFQDTVLCFALCADAFDAFDAPLLNGEDRFEVQG